MEWQLWERANGEIHMVPANDLREHVRDGFTCWCAPFETATEPDLIQHVAADGRDRKPS